MVPFITFKFKNYSPVRQALITAILLLVSCSIVKLMQWVGWIYPSVMLIWIVSTAFLLLFVIFNSVLGLFAKSFPSYFSKSIISYVGLAVIAVFTSYLFTNTSIENAASMKWIYIVLSFSYLVFLSIVGLMKKIIELAQKKDTRNFDNRDYWKNK